MDSGPLLGLVVPFWLEAASQHLCKPNRLESGLLGCSSSTDLLYSSLNSVGLRHGSSLVKQVNVRRISVESLVTEIEAIVDAVRSFSASQKGPMPMVRERL